MSARRGWSATCRPARPSSTVWQALAGEFPAAAPYRAALSAAVNASYAKFSTPVAEGDEVAFLPPVSGG